MRHAVLSTTLLFLSMALAPRPAAADAGTAPPDSRTVLETTSICTSAAPADIDCDVRFPPPAALTSDPSCAPSKTREVAAAVSHARSHRMDALALRVKQALQALAAEASAQRSTQR